MARAIAEQSSALKITSLKRFGYLGPGISTYGRTITWTNNYDEKVGSIGINVLCGTDPEDLTENYIQLYYTNTSYWTGEKSEMDYKVQLTTTRCHFGGVRYWFICPLSKNGRYCGRRVGVLYSVGKYKGCRYCADVAYYGQFEGGKYRVGASSEADVEKAWEQVKRTHYAGKPTRKYKRYKSIERKSTIGWLKLGAKFGMKL